MTHHHNALPVVLNERERLSRAIDAIELQTARDIDPGLRQKYNAVRDHASRSHRRRLANIDAGLAAAGHTARLRERDERCLPVHVATVAAA